MINSIVRLIPFTKIYAMSHREIQKCKTIKHVEGSGQNLQDFWLDKVLGLPHECQKYQTEKLNCLKIKNFCSAKDTINRIKEKLQTVRKYMQTIHLTKGLFPVFSTLDS